MNHNTNKEIVSLKLERGDLNQITRLLLCTAQALQRDGSESRAERLMEIYSVLKQARDVHDEKAAAKGWRE